MLADFRDAFAPGQDGDVIAALLGAIVSSLAAVLNAASTLLTMDVYQRYIDPKATKTSILGVPNYPMILKEVEQRFAQFWEQFDRNIEHYYRGRFDRAYRDKMEDKP